MLCNIIDMAPTPEIGKKCLEWMAFMENDLKFWPFGGLVHQNRHWARVLVLASTIAHHEGLSDADIEALAMASAFHDTRRIDSWLDLGHGARAAEYYEEYCEENGLRFDPRAYLAIKWHDVDDSQGLDSVTEWDELHVLEKDWTADATTIFKIFKDSDGLDRMRLREEALDMRYIRMPYSKTLKPFALDLLHRSQMESTWGAPGQKPNPQKYLVVVDVQNDFVGGSLGSPEAVAALPAIEDKVRNFDGVVVFTKDTHTSLYPKSLEGKKLPVEHCKVGTDGWLLAGDLEQWASDHDSPVYMKGKFGSLDMSRDFEDAVAWGNVESIELIGICTDICVVSNAMILKSKV
ncbi:MAG: cysteine hydrolase family protein, partial [Coriobacteriales bacterium]